MPIIEAVIDDDLCLFDGAALIIEGRGNPSGRIGQMDKTLYPLRKGKVITGETISGLFIMEGDTGYLVGDLTETWVTQ